VSGDIDDTTPPESWKADEEVKNELIWWVVVVVVALAFIIGTFVVLVLVGRKKEWKGDGVVDALKEEGGVLVLSMEDSPYPPK